MNAALYQISKRIPKEMPNNYILKLITFPPPAVDFRETKTIDGRTIKPRISMRIQDQIRMTCELAGLDAEKLVGLPPITQTLVTERDIMGLGSDKLKLKQKRNTKITENLQQMDKRIAAYREDRRKKKLSLKSELPF